ncbi:ISL3 family transposase ISMno5 [Deinococcus carri]|uniref:ISL3 family transposase ISMno5 n=1 Tax=Deinococcus carri TaxID=1211323 RepID=A0ABP9W4V5_9DEIO
MNLPLFPETWQVLDSQVEGARLILLVQDQRSAAACPSCQQHSSHVHSHYVRHPHDTALGQRGVTLLLRTRRFRCLNPDCPHTTFAETWLGWLEPRAQRTCRLAEKQGRVALSLGGEAGHRLLAKLCEPTSADTLLRLVRRTPLPPAETPTVLGVDDFALRRRKTYGTLLIDLERHHVVDLLPDRQGDTLAAWLKAHPGVKIICRDRAGEYARGAASGAPEAQQIADRFHLIGNVRDAVEIWLRQQRAHLTSRLEPAQSERVDVQLPPSPPERPSTTRKRLELTVAKRQQRQARYEQAVKLREQGQSYRAIARQVGVARSTVTEWLQHEGELTRKTPPSSITPYAGYIRGRMAEPEWNVTRIFHEVVEQGYRGAFSGVSSYVLWLKEGHEPPSIADQKGTGLPQEKRLSPVQVAWLFTMRSDQRSETETRRLQAVLDQVPRGQEIYQLVQDLLGWLREAPRSGASLLTSWIEKAQATGLPDLQRLARSFQNDFSAICGAIESPWSNGQTEGQVNRLKMIKRQMFGRAKFDLLRQRVLLA